MLESRLAENKYIDEAAVIGDQRKFVTALIVPNLSQLRAWPLRTAYRAATLRNSCQIRRWWRS